MKSLLQTITLVSTLLVNSPIMGSEKLEIHSGSGCPKDTNLEINFENSDQSLVIGNHNLRVSKTDRKRDFRSICQTIAKLPSKKGWKFSAKSIEFNVQGVFVESDRAKFKFTVGRGKNKSVAQTILDSNSLGKVIVELPLNWSKCSGDVKVRLKSQIVLQPSKKELVANSIFIKGPLKMKLEWKKCQ